MAIKEMCPIAETNGDLEVGMPSIHVGHFFCILVFHAKRLRLFKEEGFLDLQAQNTTWN